MNDRMLWVRETAKKDGVFVDDKANYFITDDLRVIPSSLTSGFSLVEELGIKYLSGLEEKVIDVNSHKIFKMLRRPLVSKCALTEMCFPHPYKKEQCAKSFSEIKEIDNSDAEHQIIIKIVLNKKNNNVLYAEVGEDFLNQLVSFLTFPLGSVFKLLGDNMPLKGCINNLYASAKSLNLEWFKSENCKNMLVSPQLASYYGCRKQLLKVDEMTSIARSNMSVPYYIGDYRDFLKSNLGKQEFIEQNPKLENGGNYSGGSYAKNSKRFVVFDNFRISSFSAISAMTEVISIIKGVDILISDIAEKEVSVGKIEVMSLLSGMLISETVLTDVFLSQPMQQRSC